MRISFDTSFDPEFPVYTRANAGEIMPHVLTPLAWSIVGPAFEEGFRITFCDDMHALPRPGSAQSYSMVGRFAGRLHLNLSAIRTVGERLPGTSASAVDLQYMGDAGTVGLPEHDKRGDDRRWRVRAAPAMGRVMAGMGRRVDRDGHDVAAAAERLDLADTDTGLIRQIRERTALLARLLGTHVTARSLTSPLLEQAVGALGRAGVEPADALRYVADIPDLESAKPSRALGELAASIDRAGLAASTLVAHPNLAALEALHDDEATALVERIRAFLVDHGHRGVGEYDPTVPVWEQRPDDAVALLASVLTATPRGTDDDGSGSDDDTLDPGRIARPLVAAARAAMHRAERTKNHAVLVTNQIRRLVWTLQDRWGDDITPERLRLCTLDELEQRALGGAFPADAELDRRADELAAVATVELEEWSAGEIRVRAPHVEADSPDGISDASDQTELTGIAGSPGTVRARARVLRSPYDALADGEVLVAHMTDTAWTPLFLAASAVVTDVGGVLSHATIVARDLGIPAVVNTKHATTAIADGDLVEVDGGAGTVRIVDDR